MADRREALKIIGAIGTTCAFPFAAGELYGQHVHPKASEPAVPAKPAFFQAEEFRLLSHLTNLIIPDTDTPGAVKAGVPLYIDRVVQTNPEHQELFRNGLAWFSASGFLGKSEAEQVAVLRPLCDKADRLTAAAQAPLEVRFFRALKNMTSDGYFTSKIGLTETLGYRGNTVLSAFPVCEIPEH